MGTNTLRCEICAWCGAFFAATGTWRGDVADSSYIDPAHPGRDGIRSVRCCSLEHLSLTYDRYAQRRFDLEELLSGKLDRALNALLPEQRTAAALRTASGLTHDEFMRALAWRTHHGIPHLTRFPAHR